MSNPPNYAEFDKEFARKGCNYEELHKKLLSYSTLNDLEIWWRLSQVSYQISLDYLDDEVLLKKTLDAYDFAEKGFHLNGNHFECNKWLAITAGKLALLENKGDKKINYIKIFVKHLKICVQLNANDQMVLFMQGRYLLSFHLLDDNEKKSLTEYLGHMPECDIGEAEVKLKKSMELNPNFIDNYITLAYLLIKRQKLDEAKVVVEKGLKVERNNKSDEEIAKELEKINDSLG